MWSKGLAILAMLASSAQAQDFNDPNAGIVQDAMTQHSVDRWREVDRNLNRGWDRGRDRGWDRDRDRGRDWRDDRRHRHHHHDRGPSFSFWYYSPPPPVYYRPGPYWNGPAPYRSYGYPSTGVGFRSRNVVIWSFLPLFVHDRLGPRGRDYHERAYDRAISSRVGQPIIWNDGGNAGRIQVTREGRAGDRPCREFQQEVTIGGQRELAYGTACQAPDGSWELVETR